MKNKTEMYCRVTPAIPKFKYWKVNIFIIYSITLYNISFCGVFVQCAIQCLYII